MGEAIGDMVAEVRDEQEMEREAMSEILQGHQESQELDVRSYDQPAKKVTSSTKSAPTTFSTFVPTEASSTSSPPGTAKEAFSSSMRSNSTSHSQTSRGLVSSTPAVGTIIFSSKIPNT